ncbi:MAG: YigZ family protein [Prevotellaceae bacterium]|nr:YigZ family protein [Prevotellaceae bacterium]
MDDTYLTLAGPSEGEYSEKGSRFLAFATHVSTLDDCRVLVNQHGRRFHDARHLCYAYMLGPERATYRAVDDGEPSGTAGRPILGQINSRGLTDVLVIVVRYFGGTKLGTSGLIRAYKTAAAAALNEANIEERMVCDTVTATFEYPLLSQVMRIVKDEDLTILRQDFQLECEMVLKVRKSASSHLAERLRQVRGVEIRVND